MEKCLEPWRDRNKSLGLMVGSRSANSRFRPAMLSPSLSLFLSLSVSRSLSLSVCLSLTFILCISHTRTQGANSLSHGIRASFSLLASTVPNAYLHLRSTPPLSEASRSHASLSLSFESLQCCRRLLATQKIRWKQGKNLSRVELIAWLGLLATR